MSISIKFGNLPLHGSFFCKADGCLFIGKKLDPFAYALGDRLIFVNALLLPIDKKPEGSAGRIAEIPEDAFIQIELDRAA